jgi:NADPH:quinone reductase-like Zn-dependent oxidoreductase
MINGQVQHGQNILITGIGGGVAITALQLCVAKGANVYVTSGTQVKIDKALELGAKGGFIYKDGE